MQRGEAFIRRLLTPELWMALDVHLTTSRSPCGLHRRVVYFGLASIPPGWHGAGAWLFRPSGGGGAGVRSEIEAEGLDEAVRGLLDEVFDGMDGVADGGAFRGSDLLALQAIPAGVVKTVADGDGVEGGGGGEFGDGGVLFRGIAENEAVLGGHGGMLEEEGASRKVR